MRYILIDLSSDNHLQQPKVFGGFAGEHNETILQVKLPDRMVDIECSGYRFDFQTSEDNKISSPLIPISELNNNIISFHLSEQLTIAGELLFNVSAIESDGDTVHLISKTNPVTLLIAYSPNGTAQLIDPNSYKDELLAMVDERIKEVGDFSSALSLSDEETQAIVPFGEGGHAGSASTASRGDHTHSMPEGVVFVDNENIFSVKQNFNAGITLPSVPEQENDAVNKKYVDEAIDSVKGQAGEKGDKGEDGYTPQRGVDYWTDEDKAVIVNETLAALPVWIGGSY